MCGVDLGGVGLRCTLRHIDDDLSLIVRVVWFYGITGRGHATSLFTWASRRCAYIALFPLSARRYACRHKRVMVIEARECLGTRMRARVFRRRRDVDLHPSAVAQGCHACVPPQSLRAVTGY